MPSILGKQTSWEDIFDSKNYHTKNPPYFYKEDFTGSRPNKSNLSLFVHLKCTGLVALKYLY